MLLILMRHGIAEDGEPDHLRALTSKGRQRTEQMARLLDVFHARPRFVFSSHRVRAVETARIVNESLDLNAAIEKTDALDFDHSWEEFLEYFNPSFRVMEDSAIVLAVGHMPQIGMLATMAFEGRAGGMKIKKAAMVGLRFSGELEAGGATLDFYLTSKLARMMKG